MINPGGLNVIALISGGKDSLYSILHCFRNGHKVVALANLHPAPETSQGASSPENEDIDSFMYQTIGHSVIPLYESALNIPLYRAPITGGAVDTARIYRHDSTPNADDSRNDETESLVPLLQCVMRAHPEANAVSAGAILSTYQRTRIENVAGRLGLTPLAWLWQYPVLPAPVERADDGLAVGHAGLLEDMAGVGCDARIIKVASGGLDEGFLWESVSGAGEGGRKVRRRIVKAMARFAEPEDLRGAVLGEGGEYETLAVDGPGFLWKGRIVVDAAETVVGDGGVAFTRLKGARCVLKEEGEEDEYTLDDVRTPALLDEPFTALLADVNSVQPSMEATPRAFPEFDGFSVLPYIAQSGSTCIMANLVAPEAGPGAGEQMEAIVSKVEDTLQTFTNAGRPRSAEDIVFATVLLRSMADFSLMNNVYVSLFQKPNPPARVTVACGDTLPADVKVMVSFVVDAGFREERQGLHVQSRSYWAPANIGPYSQAMSIPIHDQSKVVYIAGQIPLEPASMEIATGHSSWYDAYCLRAVLSLQHLWRIGEAMQVDWWLGGVAFLTGAEHIETQVRVAWRLWQRMHNRPEDDDDENEGSELDAWDIKYGRRGQEIIPDTNPPGLPHFSVLEEDSTITTPPFLAVEVDGLPRGSDIEWQGLGSQCQQVELTVDGDTMTVAADDAYSLTCLEIGEGQLQERLTRLNDSVEFIHGNHQMLSQVVLYTTQPVSERLWAGQVVPCRSIWGRDGRPLIAGVVIIKEKKKD
ncbi:hypothetical protein N7468_006717 [Penicillium chermesinum]|uniref:Diphthine--ammonia ligase n=1 Tax=Penicillium chermesinum TaxID=63820 RepID=A0A9W9NSR7_9EURO|nr:uncharacterized protein N7468_006717 [Penicillium chermesinum]KAJ5225492.1 hypothetical protein N7468_006717 [Penicillium chermesinum]